MIIELEIFEIGQETRKLAKLDTYYSMLGMLLACPGTHWAYPMDKKISEIHQKVFIMRSGAFVMFYNYLF